MILLSAKDFKYKNITEGIQMDVIGLWEVVSGQIFDTKNMEMVWVPKEVALASEEIDDDFKKIYTALFEFKENGSLCMMMKGPAADSVPKDELDAAVDLMQ